MKPIAIVIPWYGPELTGGAEQQARQIALRLAGRGHGVVVLTTCNRSFLDDWSVNHHEQGETHDGPVTVRRFPVDARDDAAFDLVNARLLRLERSQLRAGVNPVSAKDAQTFIDQNIRSIALLDHLGAEKDRYHAFLFLPYMFTPAVRGIEIVAEKAWLQPCLHDEPAAYFPQIAETFRRARGLLFNSAGEMELALRLFGPGIYGRSEIAGEGIEPAGGDPEIELPHHLKSSRFVLYLGRRDETKNANLLVRAFTKFKQRHADSDLKLVLAGAGAGTFEGDDIYDLGLVSNDLKNALVKSCAALAQPSHHESFSRTIMEAWTLGRPVLVQRHCLATATAVKESGGGLLAADEKEWADLFARVEAMPENELQALGARGKIYAEETADWSKVIPRYEMLLGLKSPKVVELNPQRHQSDEFAAIHQLLPDIAYGDAISNQARAIRAHLRRLGYQSEIFVKRRESRMATEAVTWEESKPAATDALLYHHSIGSELTAFAVAHSGPKCLIYHNITPADFFKNYRPGFSWMLETGRAHLPRLAPFFPVSVGDSAFNAAELTACGFQHSGVLPIMIDPERWNLAPDDSIMARLQDGRTNVLYVGRVAPNKQQDCLIEMFAAYHRLDPAARLIIAGEARVSDPFSRKIRETIAAHGLEHDVEIAGQIGEAALLAYYRTAHLYWSASAHEGFGAPLVEAMWFDVPVLAMKNSAVPETLGPAGVLYDADEKIEKVAAFGFQLVHDLERREAVIRAQRQRRVLFTSSAVSADLGRLIEQMLGS